MHAPLLVLLGAVAILALIDAQYLMLHALIGRGGFPVLHVGFVIAAIACFALIYVDGAIAVRSDEPYFDHRRRAALLVLFVLCGTAFLSHAGATIIDARWPTEIIEAGGANWESSYPRLDSVGALVAFGAQIVLMLATLAAGLLAIWAPACAARVGPRHAIREAFRTARRDYFAVGLYYLAGFLILLPAILLATPLSLLWQVAPWKGLALPSPIWLYDPGDAAQLARFITTTGSNLIALGAATSAILFGIFLWAFSRAVSRRMEREARPTAQMI